MRNLLAAIVLIIASGLLRGGAAQAVGESPRVFVPAYWSSADTASWERLIATIPPGSLVSTDLGYAQPAPSNRDIAMVDVLARLHQKGVRVACYVPTNYGLVDTPHPNGQYYPLARIRSEIDACYATYDFDGIYLDNVQQNPCPYLPDPATCANAAYVTTFYTGLRDYVKARAGVRDTLVVLNAAGLQHLPDAITWGDFIQVTEYPYSRADATGAPRYATGYAQPTYVHDTWPADKLIHVVTGVEPGDVAQALGLATTRNAGWLYLTNLTDPRSYYNALPVASVWEALVAQAPTGPSSLQQVAQPLPQATDPVGCAAVRDTFTGPALAAQWTARADRGGTASQADGQLRLTPGGASTAVSGVRVALASRCPLLGSSASVRVLSAGSTRDGENAQLAVSDGTYNNLIALQQQNNRLVAYAVVGGKRTVLATVSYSPVLAQWWRLREAGGTVYFEYSREGTAWTILAQTATAQLFALDRAVVAVEAASFGAAPATLPVDFDDFNVIPVGGY